MPRITPNLWFDTQSLEAAEFYVSVFPSSKVTNVFYYGEAGPGPAGTVLTVDFALDGQEYTAINGGPMFSFSEAVSLLISCETGGLAADQLRRSGRGRPLLGRAFRGWRRGQVRMAEGQVWPVVAGRPGRHGGVVGRPGPGPRPTSHESDAGHEETRSGRAPSGCRSGGDNLRRRHLS